MLPSMSRLPEPVKARRGPRGTYLVSYREAPGRTFTSPIPNAVGPDSTVGHSAALSWGKRNRERLLAEPGSALALRDFIRGFFEPSSSWVTRQAAKGRNHSALILAMRQGHVDNYLLPLFGDMDPRALTGRYIDDGLIGAKRKGGQALARGTKYKIAYSFGLVLEDLVEGGIIPSNPLAGIAVFSKAVEAPRGAIPREAMPRLFPATHGELVKVWGSPLWSCAMLVFHDTGMRPIELTRLTWGNLYREILDGRELWALVFQGAKGGALRASGLALRTAQELQIWRAQSKHTGEGDLIFTLDGGRLTDAGILKAFRRGVALAVGEAGAGWTTYYLRHSFVTYALEALSEEDVAMLAGHSVQVDRNYQHPDDEVALKRSKLARATLDRARKA